MPKGQVFGNRVVVSTADYKHIQKFKNEVNQREEALAQWQKEQKERKERLEVFNEVIRSRRNSAISMRSANIDIAANESNQNDLTENSVENTQTEKIVENLPKSPEPSNTTCAQCNIL